MSPMSTNDFPILFDEAAAWRDESESVFKKPYFEMDEAPLGLCRVCGAPVLSRHQPQPVYASPDGHVAIGMIHGAFDCTDQPRCEESTSGSYQGDWSARCLLPANHVDDEHYWGEPG